MTRSHLMHGAQRKLYVDPQQVTERCHHLKDADVLFGKLCDAPRVFLLR